MVSSRDFLNALRKAGFDYFSGVPCSIFKPLYQRIAERPDIKYIAAVREDAAIGVCFGAFMTGRQPVLIMQNSGIGVALNALTSLCLMYKIPLLMIVSWRGYLGHDAPEHLIMGDKCTQVLETVGVSVLVLEEDFQKTLSAAVAILKEKQVPVAIFVKDGVLS